MGTHPKERTAKRRSITSLRKSIESGEKYSVSCFPRAVVVEPDRIITVRAIQPIVVDRRR
jgi:hypothetical protein